MYSDVHRRPIAERIDWLFDLARRHGESFSSPEAWLARERYLAEHPTAIAVLKCMDGRINIPVATNTPTGILMPFRNLGGMFDLGWPHLGEVLAHHVQRMVSEGRRVLFLITYHWSKGDPARGCAGFALRHAGGDRPHAGNPRPGRTHLRQRPRHRLPAGLRLRNRRGCPGHPRRRRPHARPRHARRRGIVATLEPRLAALLPDMPAQMRADLLPLLAGNLEHIAQVREQVRRRERTLDIEHREWMICLGRGFDFLHTPNLALIIGPYSPDLADPIRKAAGIIEDNMKAERIPADGFLLLASVPYDEIGVDRARAELKSRFLSGFAADVIRAEFPDARRAHGDAHRGARLALAQPGDDRRPGLGPTGHGGDLNRASQQPATFSNQPGYLNNLVDFADMSGLGRDLLACVFFEHHVAPFDHAQEIAIKGSAPCSCSLASRRMSPMSCRSVSSSLPIPNEGCPPRAVTSSPASCACSSDSSACERSQLTIGMRPYP